MKWIAVLALTLGLVAPPRLAAQATGTISGTVTGSGGRPLAGAAVAVTGTTRGAQTDASGRFSITAVPAGARTVRASFAGYTEATRPVTVAAGQTATVNIALTAQAIQLDEVVAIGYGTARRRDVAGAVASVKVPETGPLTAQPSSAVGGALQGRAPGVQVVSNSGAPGAGVSVRVRGSNSIAANAEPLYVVDGLPVTQGSSGTGNPLAAIDPSDIESMEILKDASQTAIYGARGANGVILITTKRGTRGQNRIEFESSFGTQKISREIDVLNAQQFMQLTNEANLNANKAARFSQADLDTAQTYDYVGAILRRAPQMSHQVTVSGGGQDTRFLVGANYAQQSGIIKGTNFGRYGLRVNLDQTVNRRLRVGNSLSLTYVLEHQPAGDGIINTAMTYYPNVAFRDAAGNWIRDLSTFGVAGVGSNPVATLTERVDDRNQWRGIGNLYAEYDLLSSLTLRSTFGGNFNFTRNGVFNPRTIQEGFTQNGVATINSASNRELTNENTLQWRHEAGPGNLDVLVGASVQRSRNTDVSLSGQNFPSDAFSYNNLSVSAAANRTIGSGRTESTLLSQLARVNYNLFDRYIFTFTGRRDGSSRFGENNKWAFFPSAAFAWRVLDEPFMADQTLFSDLKFRVSYGKTGNQAISEYQSLARLSTNYTSFGRTATELPAIAPTNAAGNPDLRWETQAQFNTGLDLGFLDNRVSITADAYQSKTTDLLFNVDLPSQEGRLTQLQNVGSVQNRGVEVGINTLNFEGDFFTWRTTLNLSRNRNKVLSLQNGVREFFPNRFVQGLDGSTTSIVRVGEPLGSIWGWRTEGLYQAGDACPLRSKVECAPGELKYVDLNGDSVITAADRQILGNGDPDVYGGFNSSMTFGPLSLDAFFNFSVGNELANLSLVYNASGRALANERADIALDRWTPTHTDTEVPRANNARVGRLNDFIVDDASFLRLQTLTVGYRLPSGLIPGSSSSRIYVAGQNVFLLTGYNGFDPEANSAGGSSTERGLDIGAYPRARSWNIGANLTF